MTTTTLPLTLTPAPRRNWRYWLNLALFTLASLVGAYALLFYIAHPLIYAYGITHPTRMAVCCETPSDYGFAYESVEIPTNDGLTLRGWYIPSQNGAAVIALHSIAANRWGVLDQAAMLARHGFGILLLDIRVHGESDGDLLPFGGPEGEDVRAATQFLLARSEVEHVGVAGWSLGAQVGLIGVTQTPEIEAVWADAPGFTTKGDIPPPQDLGEWLYVPYDTIFFPIMNTYTGVSHALSLREAVAAVAPRPLMLVGGGGEERGMRHFLAYAQPDSTELWIIPGAGHISGPQVRPEEYEQRLVKFFERGLLSTP